MKISTTYEETKEIDLVIPFFRKKQAHGMTSYLSMMTEGFVNTLNTSDDYCNSQMAPFCLSSHQKDIKEAYLKEGWEEVTEEEFIEKWEETLKSQSLKPVLSEKNPDDISGVL